MTKRLILCDCEGSQKIDAQGLSAATGLSCSRVHTALCTREIESAATAIQAGDAIIACGQEMARFEELADELGVEAPLFVDLRDRAGWNGEGADTTPKMAALAAEAMLPSPPVKTLDVTSAGACLIIGSGESAFAAAAQLAGVLSVTVLQLDDGEPPVERSFEVIRGTLVRAQGTLGQFSLRFDGLQMIAPGGRGAMGFTAPRDGGETTCDLILDLSGGAALFPAPHKRDGYLRADPGNRGAVAEAIFEAGQYVGTFEKPVHLAFDELLCAHTRAGQSGCTRCLDICPTSAIQPAGEHVEIDPYACAGCGACASLCPSGAITYDAPPVEALIARMRVMVDTYIAAGGNAPRLLVHDEDHGGEMIRLAARFGRGLPADVIPLSVPALSTFGHTEILAALVAGYGDINILLSPRSERDPLAYQISLAEALGASGRVRLCDVDTPDALSDLLYDQTAEPLSVEPTLTMGSRRQITRTAAKALNADVQTPIALPDGAPYGAVLVDTDACTLCLSCVSLCPSGALVDNEDMPQLRFQEDACLQCGICATACPESAITLEPRMDLSDAALKQQVLNEEEPFCCIECGAAFGVKSTVEKIVEKLAGKHSMFADSDAGKLIQMCDNCRIKAQYHSTSGPMAMGERPRVRTTDDYFSKRKDH
jgi:ferredoxin